MDEATVENKAQLRKQMLDRRDSLSRQEVLDLSRRVADMLFSEEHFRTADTVAFYLPKGNEVDTSFMIESVLKSKQVLVPVTNNEIEMVKFSSFKALQPGKFGVLEPSDKVRPLGFSDVVIVPGICFGLCMHRLGYGKGYYDRFLSRSPAFRVGLCFDFQIVEKLPSHENDQRMDMIITEKRMIRL